METRITSAGGGKSSVSGSRTGKQRTTLRGGNRRTSAVPELLKRKREGLSFVSDAFLGRKYESTDWFDVPDEEYGEGNKTGALVVAELMVAMQRPLGERSIDPVWVIKAAVHALDGNSECSRRGAAVGFLRGLEKMIAGAAMCVDHRKFFANERARRAKWEQENNERIAEEKRVFVSRMQAAKALKKAKGAQQ